MTALGTAGAARVLAALVAAALCGHPLLGVSATLNFVLNSNAIKNTPQMSGAAGHPGSAVSAAPGIPFEGVNKYHDKHQVRGVLRIGNAAIPNRSHLGKRAQNGLCKSSSRCVWQLPLGAVSGKVLERWAERDCEASRSAELGAQVPHPLPAPFPQPYPCAEDAECSADEYCASPTRGAGAQICQACRKLRKRCLRHAMCCPGNHCKNGESGSSLSDSNHPLPARLQLSANPLSWEHFGTTLPMGVQRARFPRKDFRLLFNLGAKISTEVLELLISFCAPRLLKRAPYVRVDTSIRICLESLDTIWEWRWAGRWSLQRLQGHQNGHVVACCIFLTCFSQLCQVASFTICVQAAVISSDLSVQIILKGDLDALTSWLLHLYLPLPPAILK